MRGHSGQTKAHTTYFAAKSSKVMSATTSSGEFSVFLVNKLWNSLNLSLLSFTLAKHHAAQVWMLYFPLWSAVRLYDHFLPRRLVMILRGSLSLASSSCGDPPKDEKYSMPLGQGKSTMKCPVVSPFFGMSTMMGFLFLKTSSLVLFLSRLYDTTFTPCGTRLFKNPIVMGVSLMLWRTARILLL